MSIELVEPTDSERGYHTGWQAFHHGQLLGANPYDPFEELELFEGFIDGWSSAQLGDSE